MPRQEADPTRAGAKLYHGKDIDDTHETDEEMIQGLLRDEISMYAGYLLPRLRRMQALILHLHARVKELESAVDCVKQNQSPTLPRN